MKNWLEQKRTNLHKIGVTTPHTYLLTTFNLLIAHNSKMERGKAEEIVAATFKDAWKAMMSGEATSFAYVSDGNGGIKFELTHADDPPTIVENEEAEEESVSAEEDDDEEEEEVTCEHCMRSPCVARGELYDQLVELGAILENDGNLRNKIQF